jgi:hypothetical protein
VIVPKATNLFDALSPMLEDHEEELFFQHPTLDIKCNQLGAVYYNEDKYMYLHNKQGGSFMETKSRRNLGSKVRVVWECYRGQTHSGSGSPHFFFANGNILDYRPENVFLSNDLLPKEKAQMAREKAKFILSSVQKLMELEIKYEKVGIKKEELHTAMLIPVWLVNARKRITPPLVGEAKKPTERGKKTRTTPEEVDEVIKLFKLGLTYYNIMIRMGWKSNQRIKKIVQDYGLVR